MSWNVHELTSQLKELGIQTGDAVLTHSSFKSLGPGEGGPCAVIQAIVNAVGPNGAALFPTHTWAGAGPDSPPTFDLLNTPSAKVGVIAETARLWPGAIRSFHPTHSVAAIGDAALWLTEGHYEDGICGVGSPYDRLCGYPFGTGYILLLGVDQERNTSIHMVEEILQIPGAIDRSAVCKLIDADGNLHLRNSKFHTAKPRRFMVIDEDLDQEAIQTRGRIGNAETRLIKARQLREFVLTRLAANPGLFWVD